MASNPTTTVIIERTVTYRYEMTLDQPLSTSSWGDLVHESRPMKLSDEIAQLEFGRQGDSLSVKSRVFTEVTAEGPNPRT